MGKMRDQWKKAKDSMSAGTVSALPKGDFGPQLDTFEDTCNKLAKTLADAETALEDWEKQYKWLNGPVFSAYIQHVPNGEKKAHEEIANLLRLIRGYGTKVHTEWTKVKAGKIGTYKF